MIEKFYETKFGCAYITKESIIILNFSNYVKTIFYNRKVNFMSKTITIYNNIPKGEICENISQINQILCTFTEKKMKNYWKYARVNFCTSEDPSLPEFWPKKYSIFTIIIEHTPDKIMFTCADKDILMMFHLIYEKIEVYEMHGISSKLFVDDLEITDKLSFFIKLSQTNKAYIVTDVPCKNLSPILTYPIFDLRDIDIIKPL